MLILLIIRIEEESASAALLQKAERKAVLCTADRIYTTEPLYKLILHQGITDMFIQHPVIDGSLNAKGHVRLARMLEEAGLVPRPPPASCHHHHHQAVRACLGGIKPLYSLFKIAM